MLDFLIAGGILAVASIVLRHPKLRWKGRCKGRCEDCGNCWKR